jgi:hypothetical protein
MRLESLPLIQIFFIHTPAFQSHEHDAPTIPTNPPASLIKQRGVPPLVRICFRVLFYLKQILFSIFKYKNYYVNNFKLVNQIKIILIWILIRKMWGTWMRHPCLHLESCQTVSPVRRSSKIAEATTSSAGTNIWPTQKQSARPHFIICLPFLWLI